MKKMPATLLYSASILAVIAPVQSFLLIRDTVIPPAYADAPVEEEITGGVLSVNMTNGQVTVNNATITTASGPSGNLTCTFPFSPGQIATLSCGVVMVGNIKFYLSGTIEVTQTNPNPPAFEFTWNASDYVDGISVIGDGTYANGSGSFTGTATIPANFQPAAPAPAPVVVPPNNGYDYVNLNCHTYANQCVIANSNTGVLLCSDSSLDNPVTGVQGDHTVNYTVTQGNLGCQVTFTDPQSGNQSACTLSTSDCPNGQPSIGAITANSTCNQGMTQICGTGNVSAPSILPIGQLIQPPGPGACVQNTVKQKGGGTDFGVPGERYFCTACCTQQNNTIIAWGGNPGSFLSQCNSLCYGYFDW